MTHFESHSEFAETEHWMKMSLFLRFPEAVTRRCSVKKVFLEISQNSQENTFLIKLQGLLLTGLQLL